MAATYAQIMQGLNDAIRRATGIELVLDYEPTTVQVTPMVYSQFDGVSFDLDDGSDINVPTYRTQHSLVMVWHPESAEQIEAQLREYVVSVPATIEDDTSLGRRLANGRARIIDVKPYWAKVGDIEYLITDFISEAWDF